MHSCPECGQACYCGGDIDDIDVGDEEAEFACEHCPLGGADDDTQWPDEYDDFTGKSVDQPSGPESRK